MPISLVIEQINKMIEELQIKSGHFQTGAQIRVLEKLKERILNETTEK